MTKLLPEERCGAGWSFATHPKVDKASHEKNGFVDGGECDVDIDRTPLVTLGSKGVLFKKRVVVGTLDEIDMLFKRHGRVGETCFRTIIDWAECKEMKSSLIGISICVNEQMQRALESSGMYVPCEIFSCSMSITSLTLSFHCCFSPVTT